MGLGGEGGRGPPDSRSGILLCLPVTFLAHLRILGQSHGQREGFGVI